MDVLLSPLFPLFLSGLALAWIVGDLVCGKRLYRLRVGILVALAVLSAGSWFRYFWFDEADFIHETDGFHYYIGSKYFQELGYTSLYNCSVLVDLETGHLESLQNKALRDLRTDEIVSAESLSQEILSCRDNFSGSRWVEFVSDVIWFRDKIKPSLWEKVFYDHGFNATPVWLLAGSLLTNEFSLQGELWMVPFIVDVGLLIVLWISAFLVFGPTAGSLSLIFWGLFPLSGYGWVGGSVLRHDWLLFSVLGVCLLQKERYLLSGLALSYAGLLRMFPLAIPAVVLFHWGVRILAHRGSSKKELRAGALFGVAFTIGIACLFFISAASFNGITTWQAFYENSAKHVATRTGNRVGLETITSNLAFCDREKGCELQDSTSEEDQPLTKQLIEAGALLAFLLASLVLQRKHSFAAIALFSIGVIPLVTSLSCYYFSFFLFYPLLYSHQRSIVTILFLFLPLIQLILLGRLQGNLEYQYSSLLLIVFIVFSLICYKPLASESPKGAST